MNDHDEDWGAEDNHDTEQELWQRVREQKARTALKNQEKIKNRTGRKRKLLKPKQFVGVMMEIETLEAIDVWKERICPTYSRSDALRYMVAEFLRKNN